MFARRTHGEKELVAHDVFASWRPSTVRIGVVSDNLAAGQRTLNQTVCAHWNFENTCIVHKHAGAKKHTPNNLDWMPGSPVGIPCASCFLPTCGSVTWLLSRFLQKAFLICSMFFFAITCHHPVEDYDTGMLPWKFQQVSYFNVQERGSNTVSANLLPLNLPAGKLAHDWSWLRDCQ